MVCLQVFPVLGKPCNIYRLQGHPNIIMGFPCNLQILPGLPTAYLGFFVILTAFFLRQCRENLQTHPNAMYPQFSCGKNLQCTQFLDNYHTQLSFKKKSKHSKKNWGSLRRSMIVYTKIFNYLSRVGNLKSSLKLLLKA